MMKSIGTIQLALGTLFVVPAVTGQDQGDGSLRSQLSATVSSLEYLRELRDGAASGDVDAISAIVATTEAPRDSGAAAGSYLETLRTDLARLRFQMDRLLGDPDEVRAIMTLPASVVRTLGLGDAAATETSATGTSAPAPLTGPAAIGAAIGPAAPSAGMNAGMLHRIEAELLPLDSVTDSARRRGGEPLSLESASYVAAPVRLGRLYVRSGRPAEAIAVLELQPESVDRTYWLARAFQAQQRHEEAADLYRQLLADPAAAAFKPHVERDLKFVEFSRQLRNTTGR